MPSNHERHLPSRPDTRHRLRLVRLLIALLAAVAAIAAADALIVGGTSLVVYPAAGLTRYFTGDTLAICNLAPTDQDANADLLISCDIAAAFAF